MPAVSERQRKFMAICAHEPGKARGKCPSRKVAREFSFKKKTKRKRSFPRPNSAGFY